LDIILEIAVDFQLNWSHYLLLMSLDNTGERKFYGMEALADNWGLRELQCLYFQAKKNWKN
jgi:predicted nuclease of restriction endonuclease-like (RecB) superfamily